MASKDEALTDTEYDQLLAACDPEDPREAVIILLAGELGLREGRTCRHYLCSNTVNFG